MFIQFEKIPWLPAFIAAAYLFKKGKNLNEIIENVIKTGIGWYLILLGADISEWALLPLAEKLFFVTGVRGGVLNTEIFGSWLLREAANTGFLAFLTAFFMNLLLAYIRKRGYLFLTGHHLMFLSLMVVSLFRHAAGLPKLPAALAAGVVTGIYAYVSVWIGSKSMEKLKPGSSAGLANSTSGAAFLGVRIGRCFRRRAKEFYGKDGKNTGYITSMGILTILTLRILLMLFAGESTKAEWRACFIEALAYGTALTMIIQGLRMFLGTFIPMFWDMGKCLLPRLIVGLDSTAVITYSPKAWWAGFLAACFSGLVALCMLILLKAPFVPLPGFTSLYFAGGVAGVFGNAEGGKTGAVVSGTVVGAAVIFMMSLFMTIHGSYYGSGAAFGETGYGILGLLLTFVLKLWK